MGKACPEARRTGSVDRVLGDPLVSAVAIAVPAAMHFPLARRALLAGKDVLVEKPLALRLAEARELVRLARRRKRVLMVGHVLEYHPAVRELKALVDSGALGDIYYIYSSRLNLGKVRREENILWSFAPHDLSVILLLLGRMPSRVASHGQHYLRHKVADTTLSHLTFPGKVRAHVYVSWLHPFKEQKLVVVGSQGMAVFDDVAREGKLRTYDKPIDWAGGEPVVRRTAESTLYFPEIEPLRAEIEHFVECVRTRRRPRTDGESGARVLRVLEACQRSLERGGASVRVPR